MFIETNEDMVDIRNKIEINLDKEEELKYMKAFNMSYCDAFSNKDDASL